MKWILRISLLLLPLLSIAQPYGNEWINYSRPYYKFKIDKTDLYRIDSTTLADAGIPIATIDPRTIGIYNREKEVAIYIEGENDGVFHGTDFIEFYAKGNDGRFDTKMYDEPEDQVNPYYSLFNDTIYYYFTWGATPEPLRVVVEDDTDFSNYNPTNWFWNVKRKSITSNYYPGFQDNNGLSLPYYTEGEGWFSARFAKTGARQYNLTTKNPYQGPGAPDAIGTSVCASTNNSGYGVVPNHHIQVHYGNPANTLAVDTIFTGYQLNKLIFPIPAGDIHPTTTKIKTGSVDGLPGLDPSYPDYNAIAYVQIRYAHEMIMGNTSSMEMYVPFNDQENKNYLEWTNFLGSSPILYVLNDTVKRILPVSTGGTDEVLIPNIAPGIESHCFLRRANGWIPYITELVPATPSTYFVDLVSASPDSAFVIITSEKFLTEANAYASYRSANPYNSYQTLVVTIEELYDQYGSGIPHHALSIRNFAEMMLNEWSSDPRYIFLIGKSVMQAENAGGNVGSRRQTIRYADDLIPTYGFPPSDISFTAGLNGTFLDPAIPIARLSAKYPYEVSDYLGKVMVHESNEPGEWMKRALHFRGGSNALEWQTFENFLNKYKTTVEDTCFGGFVHTFRKNSSDIIEQQLSDSVADLINSGVSLMTFFGHASGSGFDINIDIPSNYDWNGHHPLLVGISCFTGNIHLYTSNSTSEQFVLLGDKGTIGFMATVNIGLAGQLDSYSDAFFKSLASENYGAGIGDHMKYACQATQIGTPSIYTISTALTYTLHGDPAIVLNAHKKPDMAISSESIEFFPEEITAQTGNFDVQVVVTNIGKSTIKSFEVKVKRTYPNGEDTTYVISQPGLYFKDTVLFNIPVFAYDGGIGINQFDVSVDIGPDVIDELDNIGNNIASKTLFITSGALLPVYPYNYQIVPDEALVLKASTGDPFADARDYRFEIDTTDLFNSPVLETTTINSVGGVVSWSPQNIFDLNNITDSTVFYWRTSPDSVDALGYIWNESSFQYIPDKEGWGQAHYYQFKNNQLSQLVYDRAERDFDFYTGSRQVRCNVKGNSQSGEYQLTQWFIDLIWQDGNGCNDAPAFHVAVIDPITFDPWGTFYNSTNPDHQFGNANNNNGCGRNRVEYYFSFRQSWLTQTTGMLDMLQNAIPDGHYVLIYTWKYLNRYGVDAVNSALLPEIESLGADSITLIPDSVPYIFFVKKGDPSTAIEAWGETINDEINVSIPVQVYGKTGKMISTVAGPATKWKGLYWNQHAQEQPTQDSTRIKLYGITQAGVEQELINSHVSFDSIPQLYNYVDAQQYPYVKLEAYLNDETANPTPAQMERWQLIGDPVPEAALDPNIGFFYTGDSLFEGQDMSVAISINNISDYDMDSVLVAYWVEDRFNNIHEIPYQRQAPLPASAVLYDTLSFSTEGLSGSNSLWVEINPINPNTGYYDQLEQYHINNIGRLDFEVERDITNPLLDVIFDGLRIIDGEVISAKPEISVRLDDENEWLIIDDISDTALFKFYMTYPDGIVEQIYFLDGQGGEILQFEPARAPENIAHIYFRPQFDQDGMHTLQIRASDVSNNSSGDIDYKIRFEVIQRSTITDVLNYPNPFTTRTQFVFTVTGSEPPTYVQIQIMTITGRVVREISNFELGPLRVGRNVTDFYWDGTDQFGDRLAQGVYLYKVTAKLNGEDIEYRESGASSYFKNGIGKMYLLK